VKGHYVRETYYSIYMRNYFLDDQTVAGYEAEQLPLVPKVKRVYRGNSASKQIFTVSCSADIP
jgi:hypothetical protein